eukprot:scaffold8563_cov97-Isochrysis_galbana.AAC.3
MAPSGCEIGPPRDSGAHSTLLDVSPPSAVSGRTLADTAAKTASRLRTQSAGKCCQLHSAGEKAWSRMGLLISRISWLVIHLSMNVRCSSRVIIPPNRDSIVSGHESKRAWCAKAMAMA